MIHTLMLASMLVFAPMPERKGDRLIADASFSATAVATEGAMSGTLFLRMGVGLSRGLRAEPGLALDFVRESLSLRYSLALRYDFPGGKVIPFFLAGPGGETNIVGPFLETRPFFLFGGGLQVPLNDHVAFRLDISREHVFGTNAQFDRKRYLLGVVIRWLRK